MWTSGRKGRRAVIAAGMIAAAVFAGAGPSATADGPITVTEAYGTLRLSVANGGASVSFAPAPGVAPLKIEKETFTVSAKCGATPGKALLDVTPANGAAGLGLNVADIGVRAKNNCASDSGRVSGTESLTVTLGSLIPSDVVVATAELDIEGKRNADLGVALDGVTQEPENLANAASDNGPDAGVRDNDRITLQGSFRALTLTAVGEGAEISLNGGGDGTLAEYQAAGAVGALGQQLVTAETILQLVSTTEYENELTCGETRSVIGGSAASAASATITRFPNHPAQPCEEIPITFQILDEGVLLAKSVNGIDTGTPQNARAQVKIVWSPEPAGLPIPVRQINLDPFNLESDFLPVQWCGPSLVTPLLTIYTHPPDTPWCLISDTTVLLSDGRVQQTQVYDGAGDPMWR